MRYIQYIASLVTLVVATACTIDPLDFPMMDTPTSSSDAVTVIGRITRFEDKDVATRGVKNEDEAKLTSMALALFKVKADGSGLDGNCVYYQYSANQQELLFTIERGSNYNYDTPYAMYVFCNMPGMSGFKQGTTLEEMMRAFYNVENLNIPQNGFPMMGSLGDTFSTTFDKDNQVFILSPTDAQGKLVAPTVGGETKNLLTIAMKAMYAKVNFTIQVKADQQIEGNYSPQFTMTGYTVNNIAGRVDFDNSSNSDTEVLASVTGAVSGNTVASGANSIKFSFYLPERLLTPATSAENYQYPLGKNGAEVTGYSNLRDEDKKYAQRFKSKLLGGDQKATHIVIDGEFRDHQNHYWDVTYTIYLGEDNYSDFNIVRNSEYNNYITIRGIQSSDDMSDNPDGIAIDHRVSVERTQPAIISLRRETLLDSHFEVRPLRIRKSDVGEVGGINAVKVEVVNPSTTNWMRIERSFGDGNSTNDPTNSKGESIYINDGGVSNGKRRYFTTNLVSGSTNATDATLAESTGVVVPLNDADECVWIYVDECTEAGDGVRAGIIRITYGTLNGSTFTATTNSAFPVVNYTINQRKLFKVVYDANNDNTLANSERAYYMEYEEEYLHNFDADDYYGSTEFGGMKWGLDGVQLSWEKNAIMTSKGSRGDVDDAIRNALLANSPKYDFYLTRDIDKSKFAWGDNDEYYNGLTHDYNGYTFCERIISYVNNGANGTADTDDYITTLALNKPPKSAVEYCYNRNKRDNNGNVTSAVWYLPAVDEIEEIVTSKYIDPDNAVKPTYARFKEFQEKFYWSSQPSYLNNYAFVDRDYFGAGDRYGYYMIDDTNRARSTSVSYSSNIYTPLPSGSTGYKQWIDADYEYDKFLGMPVAGTGEMKNTTPKNVVGGEVVSGSNQSDSWNVTLTKSQPQSGNKARTDMARIRCVRKMN